MKRLLLLAIALGAGTIIASKEAGAALSLGYADEFALGWIDCTSDNFSCTWVNLYQGRSGSSEVLADAPNRWEFIGQQGANSTGRSNARVKLMFRWEQLTGANCLTSTATISRFKVTSSRPTVGSPCDSGTQSLQAVSSQTFTDCTSGETKIQQRLLPTHNFSAETATSGDIGYRETLGFTSSEDSGSQDGCFTIHWF